MRRGVWTPLGLALHSPPDEAPAAVVAGVQRTFDPISLCRQTLQIEQRRSSTSLRLCSQVIPRMYSSTC